MNFFLKGTNSVIESQIIVNKKRLYFIKNNCQLISRQIDGNQTVLKRRYSYSTALIILSQFTPFVSIIFGRYLQQRWPKLKYMDRKTIIDRISNNRLKVFSVIAIIGVFLNSIINKFSEETPLTKRRRFVIFKQIDVEPLSEMMSKMIFRDNKKRILPETNKYTQRVQKIIRKLLESNKEFDELSQKNWSVHVIRAPDIANAFVLPTGHIFVYSGIINVCDNDDQLAAILAHELSHTLLNHGKEVMSREVCINFINSLALLLFWTRFHPIKAFVCTLGSGFGLNGLFVSQKRKSIELEADYVGLELVAKACFDVREGSAFWLKMSSLEDESVTNSLSTHPSNISRSLRMDSYMESMIKMRDCSDCPKLSETDPRLEKRRLLRTVKRKPRKDLNYYLMKIFK